jgi:uroporphyrinogen decarboxylase
MNSPERMRATYEFKPVDHLFRREFYIWQEAIERWKGEGLPADWQAKNLFGFDPGYNISAGAGLGWCEPPFVPPYEAKVIEAQGEHEIIQDVAGRWLKVFKGRRHGFMPDYLRHPVTSRKDWEEEVAPRLDPLTPARWVNLDATCAKAKEARSKNGTFVTQGLIGGYMYLRALMGPEDILYAFHDEPDLIHDMMKRWLLLMNTALEKVQELDELLLAEDICYNHGLLISPDMMRRFLLPYYRELLHQARQRQQRKFYFTVDTDGYAPAAIPLYLEVGMDVMWPFEVASGCDVVKIGREYPRLVIMGGIDKRVLAAGREAIDEHLSRVIPAMLRRGGYVPMCDHGVPDNVSLQNYLYYRRRICELDH